MPNLPARGLARWLPAGWVRNASIALGAIGVVTVGGIMAIWFGSSLTVDQRIAAISAVLTFAGTAVAVLAAVLAILAYLLANRRANLSLGWVYGQNADGTYFINPDLMNYGDASASSARITLTYRNLAIVSTEWRRVGSNVLTWDAVDVHVGQYANYLPSIFVRIDLGEIASLWWNVAADRVNTSGGLTLNPDLDRHQGDASA